MNTKSTPEILSLLKKTMKTVEGKIHLEASSMVLKDQVKKFSLSSNQISASIKDDSKSHIVILEFKKNKLKDLFCTCSKVDICKHIATTILYGIEHLKSHKISENNVEDVEIKNPSPHIIDITQEAPFQSSIAAYREKSTIEIQEKISDAKLNSWISKFDEYSNKTLIIENPIQRKTFLTYKLHFGLNNLLSVSVNFT